MSNPSTPAGKINPGAFVRAVNFKDLAMFQRFKVLLCLQQRHGPGNPLGIYGSGNLYGIHYSSPRNHENRAKTQPYKCACLKNIAESGADQATLW